MKRLVFLLWLTLCNAAGAFDLYVAGGVTQYRSVDGQWFVANAPHKTYLNPPNGGFDVSGLITDSWHWRTGYRFLGSIKSWSIATTVAGCTAGLQCPFLAHWYTSGHINALYAAPQWDLHRFGGTASVFLGPAFIRDTEHVNVPDWHNASAAFPITLEGTHKMHVRGVAGVGVERGRIGVELTQWYVPVAGMIWSDPKLAVVCSGCGTMPPLHTKWVSLLDLRIKVW
jgi:hypothetical protein